MRIELEGIGKRFHKEWIFRNINLQFEPSKRYAIVGNNGSGKSTLLQLISSIGFPTEGTIRFESSNSVVPLEEIANYLSFVAPYQELRAELTGHELFDFHFKFRERSNNIDFKTFLQLTGLEKQGEKLVKYYSSGMKQRMRLGLCVFTKAEAYFLDEPTTNLDKQGMAWYQELLKDHLSDKLLIISSNIEEEYRVCDTIVSIADFKSTR